MSINFILKLKALLHDPVHKIWLFAPERKINLEHEKDIDPNLTWHEKVAEDLFRFLLAEGIKDEKIEQADQMASGLSRIVVAPQIEGEDRKKFDKESSVSFENAIYIDPFTGKEDKIGAPENHEKIKKVFEILGNINFNDQEERAKFFFLFLWRFFPDIFHWIEKYPADSRAPNHSIYDHLVQTSAIAACLDNNDKPSFLLFTITPVQSFIATARKTSDLSSGSYLLSYLIYKAIEVIMEELGPDHAIFPNLRCQPLVDLWLYKKYFKNTNIDIKAFEAWKDSFDSFCNDNNDELKEKLSIANFPNRFLAIVPYSRVKDIGKKCEEKIEETIKELLNGHLNDLLNDEIKNTMIFHITSYLKPYWVALPFYKDSYTDIQVVLDEYKNFVGENNLYKVVQIVKNFPYNGNPNACNAYSLLVELTEKFMAIRKMIKDFTVIPFQTGEKCHLCGEYDILYIDWVKLVPHYVNKSERLCGVCLFKRLLPDLLREKLKFETRFPSTSEMATVKYKACMNSLTLEKFKNKLKELNIALPETASIPKLKDNHLNSIDGQWLMESSYREKYLEKEFGIEIDQDNLNRMKTFLKESKINPPTYYAIFAMDGDNMGRWLKGEYLPEVKELIHFDVSKLLTHYANNDEQFKTLLDSNHPMSPSFHNLFSRRLSEFALNTVKKIVEKDYYGKLIYAGGDDVLAFLPVDDALNCAFDLNEAFKATLSEKASTSCGIVFVHHKYPLSLALNDVRDAEKMAKNKYERSAVCIKYIAGSGQKRVTGFKWDEKTFFDTIINKYKVDELSSKFAYDFMDIVKELSNIQNEGNISDNVINVLKNELKRLYRHKLTKDKYNKDFEDNIINLLEKYKNNTTDFADMLIIARFIATIGG